VDPITIGLIISALAAGAGTYLQYDAQRDAQKRQKREIEAAQASQAEFDKRRQAQVLENAVKLTDPQPQEQLARVVAPAQDRLAGVAQQAAPTTAQPARRPVGASSRYDTEMAKRAAAELERAIAEAGMAARAGGGRSLMFEQGLTAAQGASDVDNLVSAMQQAARNSQTRINQAGVPNAGQMLAGGLVQATGSAIGDGVGGMFGTTPAAAGGSGVTAGGGATGLNLGGSGTGLRAPQNTLGWNPMYGLRG